MTIGQVVQRLVQCLPVLVEQLVESLSRICCPGGTKKTPSATLRGDAPRG